MKKQNRKIIAAEVFSQIIILVVSIAAFAFIIGGMTAFVSSSVKAETTGIAGGVAGVSGGASSGNSDGSSGSNSGSSSSDSSNSGNAGANAIPKGCCV
jgi:hypothetical protein